MKLRGIRYYKRESGLLINTKLIFNKISNIDSKFGYANIVPEEGNRVEGIIYSIHDVDIHQLDTFEGYPEHYFRGYVKVTNPDGKKIMAVTYIANPQKTKKKLIPSDEYLEHLLAGKDYLSEDYYYLLLRFKNNKKRHHFAYN